MPFADTWNYIGSYSKYISWAAGVGTATVAAIIATALGGPVSAVIAGASVIAAACIGGTLYWTQWYSNGTRPSLKTDWSFTASTGDRYGTYTFTIKR